MTNKTHAFICPVCHKSHMTITDGEQAECPQCHAKIRYNWQSPYSVLDILAPMPHAEVEIDGEWLPFLLPPVIVVYERAAT